MSLSSINNLYRRLERLPAKIGTLLGVLAFLLKLLEQHSLKILTMGKGDLSNPYAVFVIQATKEGLLIVVVKSYKSSK